MSSKEHEESSYTLEVIPGSRIALFHWSGPITLEDRRQNVQKMVEFCKANEVRNLIVDGRDQLSETDTLESFQFADEVVPDEMKGLRIAVIYRSDDDSLSFIETVAHNRGARTKAFQGINEARAWLESFDEPTS